MDNLDNFFDVLPIDESQTTQAFAPFLKVRQSWAAADSICRGASNWIVGNFTDSLEGAHLSAVPTRIASRAVISVTRVEDSEGRAVYTFFHV